MKELNIKHITNLHSDALRGLDFYKQEITILKKRLEEIAADNTGHEAAERVEYFQNQFLIQNNNIDELKHGIHENIQNVEDQIRQSGAYVKVNTAGENLELYDQYIGLEKVINEVRHEFNRFASKWM